jgi:hypothetical protein
MHTHIDSQIVSGGQFFFRAGGTQYFDLGHDFPFLIYGLMDQVRVFNFINSDVYYR